LMVSLNPGMFLPPASIHLVTLISVTFFPSENVSRVYKPLRPGPIFCAAVSAKWQEAQCWLKRSFPELPAPVSEAVGPAFVLVLLLEDWAEAVVSDQTAAVSMIISNVKPTKKAPHEECETPERFFEW
jgi:hypothetical protein